MNIDLENGSRLLKLNDFLIEGINEDAVEKGFEPTESFGFSIRDSEDNLIAGVSGYTVFGVVYVDLLYVKKAYIGYGYARQLMDAVEHFTLSINLKIVQVDTMSFQALEFYEKLGYRI